MRTSTIKTSGGDYSSYGAWEASIADTDDETGIGESAAVLQSSTLTLDASNTGGYIYLLTADDASKLNAATAAAAASKARITNNVVITGTGWIIEKVGFTPDTGGFLFNGMNVAAAAIIRRCGFDLISSTLNDFITCSANVTFSNCFSTGAGGGVVIGCSGATLNIYHMSIIVQSGGYAGYYTSGGTINTYACIAQGTTGNNWKNDGGTIGGDYNVSEGTTAPGTHNWHSVSGLYENETSGSEDFALEAASQGVYLVPDYSGTIADVATDLVGTARTGDIDAGVWQTPSSAPTPVDITKSLAYDVVSPVAITKGLIYEVVAPVAITKGLIYDVIAPVAVTKSLQYEVVAPAEITKSLQYDILTSAEITKSLQYEVLVPVAITKSLVYEVVSPQAITKSLQYEVTSAQAITKGLIYVVVAPAEITKGLGYEVITPQEVTKSLEYVVSQAGEITKGLQYEIIASQAITKGLQYHVLASEEITKALTYRIVSPQVTKSLSYQVRKSIGIELGLRYVIMATYPYRRKTTRPYQEKVTPYTKKTTRPYITRTPN